MVLLAAADPQVGTDVLSGYVSFFVDAARLPDQPGLGPVQEHRRKRAAYTMPLLRKRIEAETTDALFCSWVERGIDATHRRMLASVYE